MGSTPLAWKHERTVLFRRVKTMRARPSNSSKRIAGGGLMGQMRTTLLSTCGGGRNELRETFITWSTLA
jgi:hypothetical protein